MISRSLRRHCYGNRVLAPIGENWHTPPSFCVLSFRGGLEVRNTDENVNTADDLSRVKTLVNFGPATLRVLQARLRRAGYTLGFATHFQFL